MHTSNKLTGQEENAKMRYYLGKKKDTPDKFQKCTEKMLDIMGNRRTSAKEHC